MDSGDERRLLRFLERIAESLERLELHFAGERPAPVAPKAEDLKDTVAAVRLRRGGGSRVPDQPDDRGLSRGGVPPAEFFSRKEEP